MATDLEVDDASLQLIKFEVFHSFYVNGILCDVELKSEDAKIIRAHKLVLAAVSQYFRAQFSFAENNPIVVVPFFHEDLKVILNFVYTGKITITMENVFMIMEMVDYFQIASLRCWCAQFLLDSITKDDVWIIKRKAEFFRYQDIAYEANNFISSHFGDLLKTSAFLEIPYDLLSECLSREYLAVHSEDDLLYFLVKWILHDEKRMSYIELLDRIDVMAVEKWCETRAKILQLDPGDFFVEWLDSAFHRRKVEKPKELYRYKQISELVLLSIGGLDSSGVRVGSVDSNPDIKTSNWKPILNLTPPGSKVSKQILIPVMKTPRTNPVVINKNNLVYVLGGTDKNNEFEVYNLEDNQWKILPSFPLEMNFPPALAVADGGVFCSGGLDIESRVLNDFWVLHENSKNWKKLAPMKCERCFHRLIDYFGSLYCFGGKDKEVLFCLTVEKYDPVLDFWYEVTKMTSFPLESFVFGSKIFVVNEDGFRICSPTFDKIDFVAVTDEVYWSLHAYYSGCAFINGESIVNGNDCEKIVVFNISSRILVSYQSRRRRCSALGFISVPMFKNPEV